MRRSRHAHLVLSHAPHQNYQSPRRMSMTLRTPLRSAAPQTEEVASWSNAFSEAEWVDAPTPLGPLGPRGRGASLPALPTAPAPALPPGLSRLLNATLI